MKYHPGVVEVLTQICESRSGTVHVTSTDEQRRTDWMINESLSDYLDPDDPALTVEGYPAPKRAVLIARKAKD